MRTKISLLRPIIFLLLSTASEAVAASTPICRVSNISPEARSLTVNCVIGSPAAGRQVLRFLDQFAGVEKLSDRIVGVRVRDARGASLFLELRGNGLFAFNTSGSEGTVEVRYEVRLTRALEPGQYALTSSLGREAAFFLAADLFPQGLNPVGESLRVEIEPPEGWEIATTEQGGPRAFDVTDPKRAVFFLGLLRTRKVELEGIQLQIAVAGKWEFTDAEIGALVESIARAQRAAIDGRERGAFLVTLAPFPQPLTGLRSAALARANTVILMLNPGDGRLRTLRHYQRHLAHEMFHFYLPNAFRIKENFDWFWEGFTRYLALVTLVETKILTLDDLLSVVGDEYDAYMVNPMRARISLVSASPEKFSDAANYEIVYRKGLVVAALFDLELRWQSRGKESLPGAVRRLYQGYARSGREVGNREVLDELNRGGSFTRFIGDYIEGVREIALLELLEPYGIVVEQSAAQGRARLVAGSRLSERQRALIAGFEKR